MTNTNDTAFIEALTWLGLTKLEASLFSILADAPPSGETLASLSKISETPRSSVYSALKALAKRGLIFCKGKYPERFFIAPISRIETLSEIKKENLRRSISASRIIIGRLKNNKKSIK